MDAKMSEAEQVMRASVVSKVDVDDAIVEMKVCECKALLSELDRLREFARTMRRLYECYPNEGNLSACIGDELETLDRARATGGEGT